MVVSGYIKYTVSTNDDPFIVEIDIDINCTSNGIERPIYPPTLNQVVYDLLEPKFEADPNVWVDSKITQMSHEPLCKINTDSKYTTHIYTNAQQIYKYANSTLTDDLIS